MLRAVKGSLDTPLRDWLIRRTSLRRFANWFGSD